MQCFLIPIIRGGNASFTRAGPYHFSTLSSSDIQGEFTKFKARLQTFDSANFPKYSPLAVAFMYDAVYTMKAAMEAAKSIEEAASKTSQFLIGPSALTMAENPDKLRSDGMMKRAGC